MDLKIINEKENSMFKRKELEFEIHANVTPSRLEVGTSISKKFSTDLDTIEIKKIAGRFGSNLFKIIVFIYKTKNDRMSTESKPRLIVEKKVEAEKEVKEEKKETQKTEEKKELKGKSEESVEN